MSWTPALKALCIIYVLLVWAMLVWPKPKNRKVKKQVIRVPKPEFQPDRIGPWS